MHDIFSDQVQEVLLPLRRLVWPELHGWGHSYGVAWREDQLDRQAAQISYEVYKTIPAARNSVRGARDVQRGQPLHYLPEPRPVVT